MWRKRMNWTKQWGNMDGKGTWMKGGKRDLLFDPMFHKKSLKNWSDSVFESNFLKEITWAQKQLRLNGRILFTMARRFIFWLNSSWRDFPKSRGVCPSEFNWFTWALTFKINWVSLDTSRRRDLNKYLEEPTLSYLMPLVRRQHQTTVESQATWSSVRTPEWQLISLR